MMITIQAGKRALGICLLLLAAGCSREQQDWRAAEAADSIESYGQFVKRHPDSELTTQARMRVAQLGEEIDWEQAGSADTPAAYRQFLAQHPSGKRAQEARIRIDNFAIGAGRVAGRGDALTADDPSGSGSGSGDSAGAGGAGAGRGRDPGTASFSAKGNAAGRDSNGSRGVEAGLAASNGQLGVGAGSAAGSDQFGVQLGAFSSAAGADSQWQVLSGEFAQELQGLAERTVPADLASGRVYRLQAMVGGEVRARAICEALKRRAQACVLVLPH